MEDTFLISTPFKVVRVHPVVPFIIMDQYVRRDRKASHVMGTIMGSLNNGVLEITNCYTVRYEFDENGLNQEGIDFNETMKQLYSTANKSEMVLGWFSTVDAPVQQSKEWYLLNDYYRVCCQIFKPIFLTVNVALDKPRIEVEAMSVTSIILNDCVLAIKMTKLPVLLSASPAENQVIQCLASIGNNSIESNVAEVYNDLIGLQDSMMDLMNTLRSTETYIRKVLDGSVKPSPEDAEKVFNALASIPQVSQEEFKQLFLTKLQDFSLVSYLSSLALKQVEIAERVNSQYKGRN